MLKIANSFVCSPFLRHIKKSELVNLQILRRMFAVMKQRERKAILDNCGFTMMGGLTLRNGNIISLKFSLFMVQPYVFEHLITTLLSYVVSLLTCRRSVKRISRNKNMNGVL